jgi:ectoine hydroxylase-related dioxygenase (phytanoyl-CoA dioxygenase family)
VISSRDDADWLAQSLDALRDVGYALVEGVLEPEFLDATRLAMYDVQARIRADLGEDRLDRAGELGVLRLMLAYDDHFIRFLELPELLSIVDHTVSETGILHLQNGFILPSSAPGNAPAVFQTSFHRDFPRYLNGYLVSINVLFAIDAFTAENGGTLVVPGSQQRPEPPSEAYMKANAVPVECDAGTMLVFDSTLWHAAGQNLSDVDRLGINHQFTRSYLKQQIDYVRALGDDRVVSLPPRVQQLLGWYTRVVTSLDEYCRPTAERLYRRGQG